ncbi:MAG TPA: hypothetical protein V6D15_25985 [Oculatellaceae cyanobacterium]
MTEKVESLQKAVKETIYLGSIPLDVYLMPDGTYKLYAESVTGVLNQKGIDLIRFMNGRSRQALPFKGYNLIHAETIEVEGEGGWIKPIPVNLATAFWLYKAIQGDEKAQLLAQACMAETIERRADIAFKFKRTEEEYNQKFGERLEKALTYNRQEMNNRRLPGDDFYLPTGIN